jgi:membrane-bound lytic murein transglycosylase A
MVVMVVGCAKDKIVLKPTTYQQLPGWEEDQHAQALNAFLKSCERIQTAPIDASLHENGIGGTYEAWKFVCHQAKLTKVAAAKNFFETYFEPYRVQNKRNPRGLFTGYHEIELKGSRIKKAGYSCPLYRKPSDLTPGKPYYSRAEINQGALNGKKSELAWVDDSVDAFFLHIQGSGIITLPDGKKMRVGYDGKNNHPYVALGKCLIEKNYLKKEDVNAESIKEWLRMHPGQAELLMEENPSYVFFREVQGDGPIGAQGVVLTPWRSLAVDHRFIPYGIPVWMDVELNGNETYPHKVFRQLVVAQDTGGAIRGPVRGDIFFGHGKEAEAYAGYQNRLGSYYLLLPKDHTNGP